MLCRTPGGAAGDMDCAVRPWPNHECGGSVWGPGSEGTVRQAREDATT